MVNISPLLVFILSSSLDSLFVNTSCFSSCSSGFVLQSNLTVTKLTKQRHCITQLRKISFLIDHASFSYLTFQELARLSCRPIVQHKSRACNRQSLTVLISYLVHSYLLIMSAVTPDKIGLNAAD